jgi:hypothetical protein
MLEYLDLVAVSQYKISTSLYFVAAQAWNPVLPSGDK